MKRIKKAILAAVIAEASAIMLMVLGALIHPVDKAFTGAVFYIGVMLFAPAAEIAHLLFGEAHSSATLPFHIALVIVISLCLWFVFFYALFRLLEFVRKLGAARSFPPDGK